MVYSHSTQCYHNLYEATQDSLKVLLPALGQIRPPLLPLTIWWPVTEFREATSPEALLSTEWRILTHLGLDNEEHIEGMLFGHFNNEAYPAGVAVDPVAVLVGMKEWGRNIDLLALIEGIL